MNEFERELAVRMELHEAEAWVACMNAAAAAPDNPLQAEVEDDGTTPLSTLAVLNFAQFNRVIAMGVQSPASDGDVDRLLGFYSSRSQSRFSVEVTPVSQPAKLPEMLERHGLELSPERVAKCWRSLDDIPSESSDVQVQLLGPEHRQQYNAVSVAAWQVPRSFGAWFGATLGWEGFRHYGVFVEDELVSTVAMYVSGDLAWTGFGATKPAFQGRGFQAARVARELNDAAELGCTVLHNEAAAGDPTTGSISLRNMVRSGFQHIYTKDVYCPRS